MGHATVNRSLNQSNQSAMLAIKSVPRLPGWLQYFARPYWLVIVSAFIAFVAGHSAQVIGWAGHGLLAFYVGCSFWLEQQAKQHQAHAADTLSLRLSASLTALVHLSVGLLYVVANSNVALALTTLSLMSLFSLAATLSLNSMPNLWAGIATATAVTCLVVLAQSSSNTNQTVAAASLIALAIQGNQLRDLHLRKVAHDKQQAANQDLIAQLETERERSDQLRELAEAASKAKTRFMAAASHDLRQPLTALSLYAESLNQVARGAATKELASHIDTSVGHLEKLFNALLDLSKLDAGVVLADSQRFALQEFIPRIDREFRDHAARKGLSFECHGPDIWIDSDIILFERIIRNLLENAIRYTKKGYVHIQWREVRGQFILDITDSGVGIAQSERVRIFDEYYQIEKPGRDRSAGLGIGLAIVRRLADLLQFDIVVESVPGVGSTFRIIGKLGSRPILEPSEPPSAQRHSDLSLKGLRLLVVDDDPQIRHAAKFVFELEQVKVQLAANHSEAMQAFEGEGPELVIADFRLGDGESGLDVLNALRKRQPSLPAMIITGDTGPEPLALVLASGYRIVHKPMSGPQLLGHARALLGENQGYKSDPRHNALGAPFGVQERRHPYRF